MNEVQRYIVEEWAEHYRDGWISRREFLRRAALLGIGASAAAALIRGIEPRPAQAAASAQASPFHVPEDDPAVSAEFIQYTSDDGVQLWAYLAQPAGGPDTGLPAVAVCHENRGLNPHIMDVTRRYAKQGYVALAPDLPSRVGPPTWELDADGVTAAFRELNAEQNARDFAAALQLLRDHPRVDPTKTAATGFCFGGGVIWRLVTIDPNLSAAAPFYGAAPPLDAVPNIRAAVFGVYGELDERINAGIPDLQAALDRAGVTYSMKVYPNAPHAFHNDTGPAYRPDAAAEAWRDTLNWFAQHLGLAAPTFPSNG